MRQALGPGALEEGAGGEGGGSGDGEGGGRGDRDGEYIKPMAVSFQCMTKSTTNKKKKKEK